MKRTALYLRVSTLDQHPETQFYDLRQLASQRGLEILAVLIYISTRDRVSACELRRAIDQILASIRSIEKITAKDRHVLNDAHKQISSVTKALQKPAPKTPSNQGPVAPLLAVSKPVPSDTVGSALERAC